MYICGSIFQNTVFIFILYYGNKFQLQLQLQQTNPAEGLIYSQPHAVSHLTLQVKFTFKKNYLDINNNNKITKIQKNTTRYANCSRHFMW